jgi:hypothetical protein
VTTPPPVTTLPEKPTPPPHVCDFQFSYTVAATCTKSGKNVYACTCGKEKITVIAKIDHDYVYSLTVESTETVAGYKLYICTLCARSYKESLPLVIPAYKLEKCSSSLLGKALPHTRFYDLMTLVMDRYAMQMDRDESRAEGMIPLPSYESRHDVTNEYETIYRYMSYTMPYSIYSDANTQSAQILCWSPEEKYEIMIDCYARVYEILAELGIDENTTKWDAVYLINNYICENRIYQLGSSAPQTSDFRFSSTYYSIFGKEANCHHYAIAFQMLCLGAGIECHYYPSKTMNHAWNQVFFADGTAFWVDTCWNDAQYKFKDGTIVETSVENGVPAEKVKRFREAYLLITTEVLLKDHTL